MGPERLTRAAGIVLALVITGCGSAPRPYEPPVGRTPAKAERRHAEIFRASTTAERLAVLGKLRARSGPAWVLGRDGAPPQDDVDPFRLFLRRAWRVDPVGTPRSETTKEEAEALAIAFVTAHADLLGLSATDVPALDVASVRVPPDATRHAFAVRFQAKLRMRGFESFESLVNAIELVVFVDDDEQIRFFANLSQIHPRLSMDTRPGIDAEDPALLRNVVGREMFFVETDRARPTARVRELHRESLGRVVSSDVVGRTLTVWVSPGPMGAYVAYHLAYRIDVGRGGHWFRFIVSADTGDLLDDATVPVVAAP